MKKVFLLLTVLSPFLFSIDAAATWSVDGKLKLVAGNEQSGGNAFYRCPESDPQKCMSGDGTTITLWGRDINGDEFPWKTGTIVQMVDDSGTTLDLGILEGSPNLDDVTIEVIID